MTQTEYSKSLAAAMLYRSAKRRIAQLEERIATMEAQNAAFDKEDEDIFDIFKTKKAAHSEPD